MFMVDFPRPWGLVRYLTMIGSPFVLRYRSSNGEGEWDFSRVRPLYHPLKGFGPISCSFAANSSRRAGSFW